MTEDEAGLATPDQPEPALEPHSFSDLDAHVLFRAHPRSPRAPRPRFLAPPTLGDRVEYSRVTGRLMFGYPPVIVMSMLACLWNRPRLDRYTDGALAPRLIRSVAAHLGRCPGCSGYVERQVQLRRLAKSALSDVDEPDWTGFFSGIMAGIAREKPRSIRDPWWIPIWKPFWGHPRLALGGVMAAGLAVAIVFWPVAENPGSMAWAGPVVVQDVSTPDPERSVMVYSSPDQALTVIWLFSSGAATDES